MIVRAAKKTDLPAIQHLMGLYGKMTIAPEHLSRGDVSVVAYDESGELAGYVWAGLMASGTIAYIDKFTISPKFKKKQVSNPLLKHLFDLLLKRKVRECFGVIKQDKYHEACAFNVLKMAAMGDDTPYTYARIDMMNTFYELKNPGEI